MHHSSTDDLAVSNAADDLLEHTSTLEREAADLIADAVERQADLAGLSSGELVFIVDESLRQALRRMQEAVAAAALLVDRTNRADFGRSHLDLVEHAAGLGRARSFVRRIGRGL